MADKKNNLAPRGTNVVAVLYIWAPYSPFEDAVNMHMSSGIPLVPTTYPGQSGDEGNASFASLINITQQLQHMPLSLSTLGEITLLDE